MSSQNPVLTVLEQALFNLSEGQDFPQCVGTAAMTIAFQLVSAMSSHGIENALVSIPDRATGLRNTAMDHIAAANSGIIEAAGLGPAIERFQNDTVLQMTVVIPFELLDQAQVIKGELDQLQGGGGWLTRTEAPHILSQLLTKARRQAAFRRSHSMRVAFSYTDPDPAKPHIPLHRHESTPRHANGLMFLLVEDRAVSA